MGSLTLFGFPANEKLAGGKASDKKFTPVSFHEPVFERIREKLRTNFVKQSKSSYSSSDGKIGLVISISKQHPPFNSQFDSRYWFAFHPHQETFLGPFDEAYACYGCGNERKVFMVPFPFLKDRLDLIWKTKGTEREYTHIVIYQKDDKYYLRTNTDERRNGRV